MIIKSGTGVLDRSVLGFKSKTETATGAGVLVRAGNGGRSVTLSTGERTFVGRGVSERRASGPSLVWRARAGAAVSVRVASGQKIAGRSGSGISERTGHGVKEMVKAFSLPDSAAWYTHAVNVRQIKRGSSGSVNGNFLGAEFGASSDGMNLGENGHAGGSWERRMYEEGNFTVKFPNREGSDGQLHRQRFGPMSNPFFHEGDEWMEIYDRGDLVFVGATRDTNVSLQQVDVSGSDGSWLLRKTREYWAGHWNHAPHDVWEHYLSLWKIVIADDFAGDDPSGGGKFVTLNAFGAPAGDSGVMLYTDSPTGGAANERARIRANNSYAFPVGVDAGDTCWRVECQLWRNQFGPPANPENGDNAYVRVGMWDIGANDALCVLQLQERYQYMSNDGGHTLWRAGGGNMNGNDVFNVVLEGRDRWIYGFVNQVFVGSIPLPPGATNCVPFVAMRPGATTAHQRVRVDSFTCRKTMPFLRPSGSQWGDYRLPGAPIPGGLKGVYYNDLALKHPEFAGQAGEVSNDDQYPLTVFSPWHKTRGGQERQDDQIAFVGPKYQTNPPRWPVPGSVTTDTDPATGIPASMIGKWFSVRWMGSVYLPLGDGDSSISIATTEGFRLWVGKTKFKDAAIDTWMSPGGGSTGSLRSHIGPESDGNYHNGWYPLLLEYAQRGSGGASIVMSRNGTVIPPEELSPQGIVDELIRLDSHWEVLSTLSETYGYQFTVEPRQFESGEFPGVMVPCVRIGRDTEKIVDDVNSANYQVKVTGDPVADSILSDGTGLSSSEVQQVNEAMDYANVMSTLFLQTEYESWGDMNAPASLQQRSNTLLALRSSPWEEVQTQPYGAPEMMDSFPLTGSLALFRWEPGDGVRIVLPVIGVEDSSPRQILGVTYPFVPEGRQGPAVSFKQRPRGFKEFMRRLQRQYMNKQRNYQKQLVNVSGSLGAFGGTSLMDEFSRVPLPHDLNDIIRAEVTVFEKPDDTDWYLWVNEKPTTFPPIQYPGKYDISGYVERWNNLPIMRVEFRSTNEEV